MRFIDKIKIFFRKSSGQESGSPTVSRTIKNDDSDFLEHKAKKRFEEQKAAEKRHSESLAEENARKQKTESKLFEEIDAEKRIKEQQRLERQHTGQGKNEEFLKKRHEERRQEGERIEQERILKIKLQEQRAEQERLERILAEKRRTLEKQWLLQIRELERNSGTYVEYLQRSESFWFAAAGKGRPRLFCARLYLL